MLRCKDVVEPLISKQWFVKVAPLAEKALKAVQEGSTSIVPEHWTKTYYEWMTNIRDWCVSRQIWWGHRVPAWSCGNCGEVIVARETPTECPACKEAIWFRKPMSWIPGSHRPCGRSRPWDGPITPNCSTPSIRHLVWSPASTFSSSGCPHDDDGAEVHERRSLQGGLYPCTGAG